jgi:hypothetical protein
MAEFWIFNKEELLNSDQDFNKIFQEMIYPDRKIKKNVLKTFKVAVEHGENSIKG